MITYRASTAEDCRRFYGDTPKRSIHALTVTKDGEPVVILGLERHRDRFICFSDVKPEFEPHLRSMPVLRALRALKDMIHEAPLPVLVVNTSNPKLIERLGFTEIEPGVHLCQH